MFPNYALCKKEFQYDAYRPRQWPAVQGVGFYTYPLDTLSPPSIWGVVTEEVITFKSAHKKIIGKYFSHLIVFF